MKILAVLMVMSLLAGCGPSFRDKWVCDQPNAVLLYGSSVHLRSITTEGPVPVCVIAVPARKASDV